MAYICFYNNGQFDRRSISIMGLSAKDDEEAAIGFFGTGIKYGIASLVRMGIDVSVYVTDDNGITQYSFYAHTAKFKKKAQEFITCTVTINGELDHEFELPYTTHLGAKWKLWQVYREFYTNAIDEGGGVAYVGEEPETNIRICVQDTPEMREVHEARDMYFLKAETIATSTRIRAVEKVERSDNVVYYRTMYTGTKLRKPALFTYDYVSKIDLTEDRTLANTWYLDSHIMDLWIAGMSYDQLVTYLPKASRSEVYESSLSGSYTTPSAAFTKACAYLTDNKRPMPMWARELYVKSLPFEKQFKLHTMTRLQTAQLKKAITILEYHGCVFDTKKLHVCGSLPDDLLGYYKDGCIYISKHVFDKGFNMLLGTLYEEHLHCEHDVCDMSREMQNMMIDRIAVLMQHVYDMESEHEAN